MVKGENPVLPFPLENENSDLLIIIYWGREVERLSPFTVLTRNGHGHKPDRLGVLEYELRLGRARELRR
jgi:hypothetical protein